MTKLQFLERVFNNEMILLTAVSLASVGGSWYIFENVPGSENSPFSMKIVVFINAENVHVTFSS